MGRKTSNVQHQVQESEGVIWNIDPLISQQVDGLASKWLYIRNQRIKNCLFEYWKKRFFFLQEGPGNVNVPTLKWTIKNCPSELLKFQYLSNKTSYGKSKNAIRISSPRASFWNIEKYLTDMQQNFLFRKLRSMIGYKSLQCPSRKQRFRLKF